MNPTILRTNASAVYRFLSILHASLESTDRLRGKKILDCGAGGPVPPLAIFAEQGMDAYGIDVSEPQILKARTFADRTGLPIHLQVADMRNIPFDDNTFDYAYEHYSMCHLSKADTAKAIAEIYRVVKPGGLAFLGLVSQDCWPLSSYGEERSPGERWMVEGDSEVGHSLFADEQANLLLSAWDVALVEKAIIYTGGKDLTEAQWKKLHCESPEPCSIEEWMMLYPNRDLMCQYVHAYYYLEKPAT